MDHRKISDRQRRWLVGEIADWKARGILTAQQPELLMECYEAPEKGARRKESLAVFTLWGVAAFLVGLGVLLLIGYNWEKLSRVAKLVIIFGVLGGTHAGAFYLRYKRNAKRSSEVVFFLGCLFYGAGIWLIAQVFHLDAHYPDGVWWWSLGVLPFALCLDTVLIHLLFVVLLGIWAGMEILEFPHLGPWLFWGGWIPPNGAYSLPLLAAPGLFWSYRKGLATAVGSYALLLAWWTVLLAIAWDCEEQTVFLIGIVGSLFLVIAESHREGSRLAIPIRVLGVLMAGGALIPLSFADFHHHFGGDRHGIVGLSVFLILIAGTIVLCVFLKSTTAGVPSTAFDRLSRIVRRQWFPVALALCVALMAFSYGFNSDGVVSWLVPTLVSNVAMIACGIWLMRVGLRDERHQPFFAGILYLFLWAILRYVDLFGENGGMIGAAIMFFLCGGALFGLALFWHRRKEVRHD